MKIKSTLIFLFVLLFVSVRAQDKTDPASLAPGYYIVVAAYFKSQEGFAQRFMAAVNKDGRHAQFGYDPSRGFYYVYLDYYTDFNASIQEMLKTRKEGGFPTAWVRIMKGEITGQKVNLLVETKKVEPAKTVVAPAVEVEKVEPTKQVETKTTEVVRETGTTTATVQPSALPSRDSAAVAVENGTPDPVYRPQILKNTPVFLSLYNPTNHDIVEGEVEVIDTEHAKLLTKVKGNDYVTLPDPKTESGKLTLICSSFGYRKEQHELNYKSTEKDTLQSYVALMGNYYMIKFDMIRLHRGDIATLYNVYFYNDAAVMLPESKYELNQLLKMMNENPKYRIRLHGHTNGRAAGKVITMGDQKNFFELTSDVKRGIGSAKDLSRARAEVIRDWLVTSGVPTERMDIKAWGGSRMVHDKNSAHARKNVRVEVEVLED